MPDRPLPAVLAALVLLALATVALATSPFFALEARQDVFLFDTETGYGLAEARANVAALGAEGRAAYRRFLAHDVVFLALQALGLVVATRALARAAGAGPRLAAALLAPAVVAALLDLVEDALVLAMLSGPGPALVALAPPVTGAKLLLGPLAFAVPVALAAAALARRALRRRRQASSSAPASSPEPPGSPPK